MAYAALAVSVIGLALQAKGASDAQSTARDIAAKKRQAAEFEAAQLRQQAGQEVAAAQRTAFGEERQSKLVQSRALALAAASGASASDPTVVRIVAGIASEGAYRQNVALYQGEEKARQLRVAAEADIQSGDIGAAASIAQGRSIATQTAGTILGTGATLFGRYGYGSPATASMTPRNQFVYDGGTAANPSYG